MKDAWASFIGIVVLIIGLAIVSVLVSKKSSTATVVGTFSAALDKLLSRSVGPT